MKSTRLAVMLLLSSGMGYGMQKQALNQILEEDKQIESLLEFFGRPAELQLKESQSTQKQESSLHGVAASAAVQTLPRSDSEDDLFWGFKQLNDSGNVNLPNGRPRTPEKSEQEDEGKK